ncbi:tryptophan synthase beta subunit-like PLP-dependent enzyme [Aspergillus tamarii]|uniref:Tryptophan synthase beta subunit-like PLP-dependent enzyme n=1 Tax=Aspergillus tamarii TaxID=41984 RepID=A0A5N6U9X3_ASPTM|nr:tryptophan synthase beta subunit-like PLP-dependent enzyme [Aspergillus tamarii]
MAERNILNVYKGRDSVKKYFDPDYQPPLPLVELPNILNPFRADGVRIYAKMMTGLPCQNVKALPALNMLQKAGISAQKSIVEPSSGSTVTSLSMISRVLYGNKNVYAYVSNKTDESRLRTLQFFGLKVVLYGGPAQPEISDPRGQIHKLKKMAEGSENIYNPGQYGNMNNPESHMRWTGPQLLMQLPEINIFCTGMGSAGCITGTGAFLKREKPSVTVVGVCNKTGDPIPGPRPRPLFDSITFPWKEVTDAVKEVGSTEAYRLSMNMSREGLICGPSSGMALRGLLEFLQEQKDSRQLLHYAEPNTREVSCVFPCCDLPYQYMDTYFQKLSGDDFYPIANLHLREIDQNLYDPRWELSATEAVQLNEGIPFELCHHAGTSRNCQVSARSKVAILDLRKLEDFTCSHVSGSFSSDLPSLNKDMPSPFDDVAILEAQFRNIEDLVGNLSSTGYFHTVRPTLVLCYSGETARLTCSILRHRDIEAYSVRGGFKAISDHIFSLESIEKHI